MDRSIVIMIVKVSAPVRQVGREVSGGDREAGGEAPLSPRCGYLGRTRRA